MEPNTKKRLTKKEKNFCYYYINTGNVKEASILAGLESNFEKDSISLLSNEEIKEEIQRLYEDKKKNLLYKACIGYERLAFGNITDAVKLLYSDNLDYKLLEEMDLFNIAEIKKPKDGAMEIKFFDRIKALEKLEQVDIGQKNDINPFYYALEKGIESLNKEEKYS
ncbi:MAG: terminase small subunit [Oscillospiraceae bacterium]|jgi:hypothetical protein|nr:terminase small subunit [Oscillospiraceae bacterium]